MEGVFRSVVPSTHCALKLPQTLNQGLVVWVLIADPGKSYWHALIISMTVIGMPSMIMAMAMIIFIKCTRRMAAMMPDQPPEFLPVTLFRLPRRADSNKLSSLLSLSPSALVLTWELF